MRTRTWIVLLLALASGLIAGYAALQLVSGRPAPLQAAEPSATFQVVVAARELPVGHLLGQEDLRMVQWPGEAVPEGYASAIPDVIGRGLIGPLRTNEPVLSSKLADRGAGGGLPILIPEGMRGVSIRVDEVIAVAGFVTPSTRVDVLLTMQPPGSTEFVTKTFLQNIEVATAGPIIDRDEEGKSLVAAVVTLYLTPDQAEQLTLATKQGTITLALRNMLDVKEVRTVGARVSRLLSLSNAPAASSGRARSAPAPTQETGNTMEVLKGGQRSIVRFGSGGNLE